MSQNGLPSNTAIQDYVPGNLNVIVSGAPIIIVGNIFIEYDITLHTPQPFYVTALDNSELQSAYYKQPASSGSGNVVNPISAMIQSLNLVKSVGEESPEITFENSFEFWNYTDQPLQGVLNYVFNGINSTAADYVLANFGEILRATGAIIKKIDGSVLAPGAKT